MASPFTPPADRHILESQEMRGASPLEQNMNDVEPPVDESRLADITARIRALNDAFRRSGTGGRMLMTAGVAALSRDEQLAIAAAVMAFEAFNPGDDQYGEHDFGALRVAAHQVMFKIDYYDRSGRVHSPDPGDPAVTCRVLTIMLAEEY